MSLGDLPLDLYEHTLGHFGRSQDLKQEIRDVILGEERSFTRLLERGRKLLVKYPGGEQNSGEPLSESDYRFLHETHGLPRELVDLLRP